MRLYISSGKHVRTDVNNRIENIENEIGEPDAIFFEGRVSNHTLKERVINWISAPILLVSLWTISNTVEKVSRFTKTDFEIVVHFRDKYGLEPYYIDKPVHEIIGSQSDVWAIANWSLLIIPITLLFIPFNFHMLLSLVALITGTISVTLAYLSGVNFERNVYMIDRIAEVAENNKYEKACVITGSQHESDLRELGHRLDDVEIISESEK